MCWVTGKHMYPDAAEAGFVLAKLKRKGRAEAAMYACRHCGCWHLTSNLRKAS